ncbi:MAG: alpha/beta fold hydrolase [Candidatus Kapabacteria bacterium]|jgi:pimeloyl-ACP methyl ester carboxylesterase|nr:alpha/beta fold hydrolase [Candidatus Kapabacteria bacterium]
MKIPYPVLLLHGLGQKADVWEGTGATYYSRELGLSYGGMLRPKGTSLIMPAAGGGDADFYVVQFSNPVDSISAWATELETCISAVLERTGADRVILVGYSMGGLASRAYLTRRLTDHRVKRLITVGTPHLGSAFARIWTWKTSLQAAAASSNPILSVPAKAALSAVQGTEGDVPYDSPAVRDLRRPEDGGDYLRRLGKFAHPLDIEYVSVIGTLDMFSEAKKLSEGWIQDLLRRLLSVDSGLPELFTPGDGVVSTPSQDIMNIEFFKIDASRRRAARTVSVPTVHVDHLKRSVDIQRITLDEKPEFKGAVIRRRGMEPVLVVDFADHIPHLCSLDITLDCWQGASVQRRLSPGSATLVRTSDGIVARYIISLADIPCVADVPVTIKLAISNTFGHRTTASLEW